MNFDEYQEKARNTAIYPEEYTVIYPTLGLAGESGEVCEKIKKIFRDTNIKPMDFLKASTLTDEEFLSKRDEIKKEIGDILWYCANLAFDFTLSLDEIAQQNIEKLLDRQERGKLQGSGDNR